MSDIFDSIFGDLHVLRDQMSDLEHENRILQKEIDALEWQIDDKDIEGLLTNDRESILEDEIEAWRALVADLLNIPPIMVESPEQIRIMFREALRV